MRRFSIFSVAAGSLAFLYLGCTQDFGEFEPNDGTGAAGAAASTSTGTGNENIGGEFTTSSSTASSSSSGSGAGGPCSSDADCNDSNTCTTDACVSNECSVVALPDGPIPGVVDMPDDCVDALCQAGVSESVPDDTEVPDDRKDCTVDSCVSGVPMFAPAREGTDCSAGICDAQGQCVGCVVAGDCGDSTFCLTWECNGGVCNADEKPNNTVVPDAEQVPGDCQETRCNGNGGTKSVTDNGDLPDDANPCTNDACSQGNPTHTFKAPGTVCNGTDVCNGTGTCVDCVDAGDCTGPAQCVNQVCVCSVTCQTLGLTCGTAPDGCGGTLNCNDNIKNGTETDVDCGGGFGCTVKCANGDLCVAASNCVNNFCADGVCCNNACNTSCRSCSLAGSVGTCSLLPVKQDDTAPVCSGAMTCDGAGTCKKDMGQPCGAGSECASGVCTSNSCT